jgi:hypothetical protein
MQTNAHPEIGIFVGVHYSCFDGLTVENDFHSQTYGLTPSPSFLFIFSYYIIFSGSSYLSRLVAGLPLPLPLSTAADGLATLIIRPGSPIAGGVLEDCLRLLLLYSTWTNRIPQFSKRGRGEANVHGWQYAGTPALVSALSA